MAKYRGKALFVRFVSSAGTADIQSDFTTFDVDRSLDTVDVSSGNVNDKEYIDGLKDATATLKMYDNNTEAAQSGTALLAKLVEGLQGTVSWGPQGTATGKPKGSFAAWVKSHKPTYPFDKGIEVEVQFQKTGAFISDYGVTW